MKKKIKTKTVKVSKVKMISIQIGKRRNPFTDITVLPNGKVFFPVGKPIIVGNMPKNFQNHILGKKINTHKTKGVKKNSQD